MRARAGAPAGSGVTYATIGVVGLAIVCATLVAILVPTLISRKEPAIAGDAAGASLVESSGNGQTVLYPLAAMVGRAWAVVNGALQVRDVGYQSDTDRLSVVSSYNVLWFLLSDAEYRYAQLYSSAGTLMFHAHYRLNFYIAANATGASTIVFSMPDEFTSPPTPDGSSTLNTGSVYQVSCSALNYDDFYVVMPTLLFSFINTIEVGYLGYPGPTLYIKAVVDPASTVGVQFQCTADFYAPVE